MRSPLLAALLITLLVAPAALAQRVKNEDIFENLTFEQAVAKAEAQCRILVVFVYGSDKQSEKMFERTFTSSITWAYLKWHAVAIKVKGPTVLPSDPPCPVRSLPTVVFIRKQKEIMRLPDPKRVDDVPNFPGLNKQMFRYCSSLELVGRLDIKLDTFKATNSGWYAQHERMNPMPKPPTRELLYPRADEGVDALTEPPPGEDPVATIAEARRLVKEKNFPVATALYTWLWERAAEADPSFEPARLSTLASDIAALVENYPQAHGRFKAVFEEHTRRSAWFDFDQRLSWSVLAASVGSGEDVLDFIETETGDEEEGAVSPLASVGAFRQIAADYDRSNPDWLPADPPKWLGLRVRAIRSARPMGADPKEWDALLEFRKRMLVREGCRLYIACLRAKRDSEAQQIAEAILSTINTPEARLALVTTALAAQQPRPEQRVWLDQAAGASPAARLRAHLEAALANTTLPPLNLSTATLEEQQDTKEKPPTAPATKNAPALSR